MGWIGGGGFGRLVDSGNGRGDGEDMAEFEEEGLIDFLGSFYVKQGIWILLKFGKSLEKI